MKTCLALLAILLATSVAQAAPVVAIDGVIARDGALVSGVFTVTVEVRNDLGDVLVADSVPSLVIEDGFFTVDVDVGAAAAALGEGQTLTVAVDLGDGLEATTHLGAMFQAARASAAARAVVGIAADSLGDVPGSELLTASSVATVPVAIANIQNLPAGLLDGDDGNVDTLGAGLVLSAGTLTVTSVPALTDGTLTSAQLQDGTISSTQLGTLVAANVADGTLTAANFAANAFTNADVLGTVQVMRSAPGCVGGGQLTTNVICLRRSCGTDRLSNCITQACEDVGPNPSALTQICRAGSGNSDGFQRKGFLLKDP